MKNLKCVFCIVVAVTAAAGCGQSKVEYKKEASPASKPDSSATATSDQSGVASPSSDRALDKPENAGNSDDSENPKNPESQDAAGKNKVVVEQPSESGTIGTEGARIPSIEPGSSPMIHARALNSVNPSENGYSWQKWEAPKNRSINLSESEKAGFGDFASPSTYKETETIYNLKAVGLQRCVFKNRLLESLGDVPGDPIDLPPPFGNAKLHCVRQSERIASEVRLAVTPMDEGVRVRWIGSSAKKMVPAKGVFNVQMKLTSRIQSHQGFIGAAQEALQDGFDILLSIVPARSMGSACALERSFFLNIAFEDGVPQSAKIFALTRHFSVHEFEDNLIAAQKMKEERPWLLDEVAASPVNDPNADGKLPYINSKAALACKAQHEAWIACAQAAQGESSGLRCDPQAMRVVQRNFKDLLGAKAPGFGTDRVFSMYRSEANGTNGVGDMALWYDPEARVSQKQNFNPLSLNPLSLEDFQEVTDIGELERVFE